MASRTRGPNKRKASTKDLTREMMGSDSGDDDQMEEQESIQIPICHIEVDLKLATTSHRTQTFPSPFMFSYKLKRMVFIHDSHHGTSLHGLRDALKENFYEDFSMPVVKQMLKNYKTMMKAIGCHTAFQLMKQFKADAALVMDDANANIPRGLGGGSLVDRHINAIINKIPIPTNANNDRYPSTVEDLRILRDVPWNLDEKQCDMVCPSAKAIALHYTKKGFIPVQAQIGAWLDSAELITAVEHIWIHVDTGRLMLIEVKIGDDELYHLGHGNMKSPFQKKINSIKNQHQLQLLFEKKMFEFTFNVIIHDAVVARVNRNLEVKEYPLERWAKKRWNLAVQKIIDNNQVKKQNQENQDMDDE